MENLCTLSIEQHCAKALSAIQVVSFHLLHEVWLPNKLKPVYILACIYKSGSNKYLTLQVCVAL